MVMEANEKDKLLNQIFWDYNVRSEDILAILNGEKNVENQFIKEMIFRKIIESYSWFTILQIITPIQIQELLTNQTISKIRSSSLRKKYEFVQKRLREIIPVTG